MKRICIVAVLGILILIGAISERPVQGQQNAPVGPLSPLSTPTPVPVTQAQWDALGEQREQAFFTRLNYERGRVGLPPVSRSLSLDVSALRLAKSNATLNRCVDFDGNGFGVGLRAWNEGFRPTWIIREWRICQMVDEVSAWNTFTLYQQDASTWMFSDKVTEVGVAFWYDVTVQRGGVVMDLGNRLPPNGLWRRAYTPSVVKSQVAQ